MRVLFDANTPAPLARFLLTCDQHMEYQQNFVNRRIALVVLSSNHWPILRNLAARVASAVDFVQTGQIVHVDITML